MLVRKIRKHLPGIAYDDFASAIFQRWRCRFR